MATTTAGRRIATAGAWAAAAALTAAAAPAAAGAGEPLTRDQLYAAGQAGTSAGTILTTAFAGSSIAPRAPEPVRVLIADAMPRMIVAGRVRLPIWDHPRRGRARRGVLVAKHRYLITRHGDGFRLRDLDNPRDRRALHGVVRIGTGGRRTIRMADPLDRRFHGSFTLRATSHGTFEVINTVRTEDYLRGVLAGELPAQWGTTAPTALEAGAIAYRSRAFADVAATGGRGAYDVTTDDPLYLGVEGERAPTNLAIRSTADLTLMQGGQPVSTSFPAVGPPIVFTPQPGSPSLVASKAPSRAIPGAPAGLGSKAVSLARSFLGTPYVWGGTTPAGFDCSGLVQYVYGRLGIRVPRVAEDQATVGLFVPRDQLQPGDVVFFADSSGYIHHEGIYIGGGQMIHAPQTGDVVRVTDITGGYYLRQYAGARRFSPLG